MLVAAPVLHHEPEAIWVEEETLGIARARRAQVDQEDHRELEALRGVHGQQRDRVGGGGLLGRLTNRQLGIDHLVEGAGEIADARQSEVALESRGQLKTLAQVEQRPRATISLGAKLGPAQISALLQQPVEYVGNRERIAQAT